MFSHHPYQQIVPGTKRIQIGMFVKLEQVDTLKKLKRASIQDSKDLTDDKLRTKAYFKCFSYIRELSLRIINHHRALIESLSIYVKGVEYDVVMDIQRGEE